VLKNTKNRRFGATRFENMLALIVGGLIVSACLIKIWISNEIRIMGYELAKMRQVKETLLNERDGLIIELQRLKSPSRLESIVDGYRHPALAEILFTEEVDGRLSGALKGFCNNELKDKNESTEREN
jgi:hypothetical protein